MDGGGPLPRPEVGLSGGAAAVRARGAAAAVPGGVPDRGVADVVRVPAGSELPGDQLRGGLRAGGMAVGVPGGDAAAAAEAAAESPGDGASGGATGGYVNRKRADEPGPQTVWLGLQ